MEQHKQECKKHNVNLQICMEYDKDKMASSLHSVDLMDNNK
jgi:hypothetical protein